MSTLKFPIIVKRGFAIAKIYRSTNAGYEQFTMAYYDGQSRKRQKFSDLAEAKREAESVVNRLCRGELDVLTLKSEDRTAYVRSCEALKKVGITLDLAVNEYVEARNRLGAVPLLEAIDFYARHCPKNLPKKTVQEVYAELLKAKEGDGCSKVYLKDLRLRLGKFSAAFHVQLSNVRAGDINEFLRALDCSGRGRNNYRMAIGTLFKFAVSCGYLPKTQIDFDQVAKAKESQSAIGIFSPTEMAALLNSAVRFKDDYRPGVNRRYTSSSGILAYFALGAFAGLRTAEIQRQDWSDINLDRGFIRVTAAKGRTAAKRLVPIQDNLRKWLLLCWQPSGLCCDFGNLADAVYRISEQASVKWKHNALRHSAISYRVAQTQSIPQVALEAGNSVGMVNRHYRELVTSAEAKSWFAIEPEHQAKIVPMAAGHIQSEVVTNLSPKIADLL